ncbi:MAG: formylglycine-generating enzyme family protein [Nitrospirota bacterium]
MLGLILLLIYLLSPAQAAEFTGKDGASMVLIQDGPFLRGSAEGQGDPEERPQRTITLSAFHIDKYEVTNRRYQAFLKATQHRTPEHCCDPSYNLWKGTEIAPKLLDHPVVNVDWHDAVAYCAWAGKRLPTEAEWEKAARGIEGREYPWGNQLDRMRANGVSYWSGTDFGSPEEARAWWNGENGSGVITAKGVQGILTVPVTELEKGATPTGLMHMAGNVWEWTAEWYDPKSYENSEERNPKGPEGGEFKVHRGGSWLNHRGLLRSAVRDGSRPTMRNHGIGFRCAAGS